MLVFPPSQPDFSAPEPYSATRFFAGWLSVMIPPAVAAYTNTHSVSVTIATLFALPCLAILQGALFMTIYQIYYYEAPSPIVPAHGVVVTNPEDLNEDAPHGNYSCGCNCEGGKRWRRGAPLTEKEKEVVDRALKEKPVRILVIGDSLACGIGSEHTCTNLLPETLAKSISKKLGGRAVFWTAYGGHGAPSSWITHELAIRTYPPKLSDKSDTPLPEIETASDLSSFESTSIGAADDIATATSLDDDEFVTVGEHSGDINFDEWRRRLNDFRKGFDNNISGPYDVVLVVTGGNDVRAEYLACVSRTNYQKPTRPLFTEFEHILKLLEPRMHKGARPDLPIKPVVVFPAMPALVTPCFKVLPNRWLAVPLIGMMDNNKRRIAKKYSERVRCVEPPTIPQVAEFEAQEGPLWDARWKEDTLLCLRHVTRQECQDTVFEMRHYYSSLIHKYRLPVWRKDPVTVTQANPPNPKLCDLPGRPGTKTSNIDGIHQNDEGSDFWGRFVAQEVFKHWDANAAERS